MIAGHDSASSRWIHDALQYRRTIMPRYPSLFSQYELVDGMRYAALLEVIASLTTYSSHLDITLREARKYVDVAQYSLRTAEKSTTTKAGRRAVNAVRMALKLTRYAKRLINDSADLVAMTSEYTGSPYIEP
jgi:hypothetical protein